MPRWLVTVGRIAWVIPAIVGLGFLTWGSFLYPGMRMRLKHPIWLRVAFIYVGLAVLVIIAIVAAPDAGLTAAFFFIVWLAGIVLFFVMLRWWVPFTHEAKDPQGPPPAVPPTVVVDAPPPVQASPSETDVRTETIIENAVPEQPAEPIEGFAQVEQADSAAGERAPIVFISHASEDRETAQVLADELQSRGVRTWLAFRDVGVGSNYAEEIVKAIVDSDYLLVVLSEAAIESPHIRREVTIAIDRGISLLPVNLSAAEDFMWTLPVDWTYWLSLAQVMRHTDEASTASELARRITRK